MNAIWILTRWIIIRITLGLLICIYVNEGVMVRVLLPFGTWAPFSDHSVLWALVVVGCGVWVHDVELYLHLGQGVWYIWWLFYVRVSWVFFHFSWGHFDKAPSDCLWIAPRTIPTANLIIINLGLWSTKTRYSFLFYMSLLLKHKVWVWPKWIPCC